ncbi:MAG: TlpA family protein disulfide reductase [Magnetococcales bacterium]|nr:TlpA family protein disulfide reductase [Magnetococcales bacterium]
MKRMLTVFLMGLFFSITQATLGRAADNTYLDTLLNTVSGDKIRLSDYKGQVLLVNFWATWCPPCRTEIPELIQFQKEFQSQGVQVIGIDFMERPDQARLSQFIKDREINYPIVFGQSSEIQKVARAMGGVFGLPVTKILDRQGTIVNSHVGAITIHHLREYMKPLIQSPSAP